MVVCSTFFAPTCMGTHCAPRAAAGAPVPIDDDMAATHLLSPTATDTCENAAGKKQLLEKPGQINSAPRIRVGRPHWCHHLLGNQAAATAGPAATMATMI